MPARSDWNSHGEPVRFEDGCRPVIHQGSPARIEGFQNMDKTAVAGLEVHIDSVARWPPVLDLGGEFTREESSSRRRTWNPVQLEAHGALDQLEVPFSSTA